MKYVNTRLCFSVCVWGFPKAVEFWMCEGHVFETTENAVTGMHILSFPGFFGREMWNLISCWNRSGNGHLTSLLQQG